VINDHSHLVNNTLILYHSVLGFLSTPLSTSSVFYAATGIG